MSTFSLADDPTGYVAYYNYSDTTCFVLASGSIYIPNTCIVSSDLSSSTSYSCNGMTSFSDPSCSTPPTSTVYTSSNCTVIPGRVTASTKLTCQGVATSGSPTSSTTTSTTGSAPVTGYRVNAFYLDSSCSTDASPSPPVMFLWIKSLLRSTLFYFISKSSFLMLHLRVFVGGVCGLFC